MRGLIISSFVEYAEERFGIVAVDDAMQACDAADEGFSAVGYYPPAELVTIVKGLSASSGEPVDEIVREFGKAAFPALLSLHPEAGASCAEPLSFLRRLDDTVHAHVRKLYADAEVPMFRVEEAPGVFRLHYSSNRGFSALAHGLLLGCVAHFGGGVDVQIAPGATDTATTFELRPIARAAA